VAAASRRWLVHDTSVYVRLLHRGGERLLSGPAGRVYVSTVVIAELHAGSRSPREARWISDYADAAARIGRLLVPDADDWRLAGQLVERRSRIEGRLAVRDHLADILVVLSASRVQAQVVTTNARHFEVWAMLARRAGRDVVIAAA
jgi:predicted nucleic acid-binding protein